MEQEIVLYILYSETFDKTYVGITSDLINRFISHNKLGHGWTAKFRPWIVVHIEVFKNKSEALKREKYFKSGSGHYAKIKIVQNFYKSSGSYSSHSFGKEWEERRFDPYPRY